MKILSDYPPDYLDLERTVFLLLVVLGLAGAYNLLSLHRQRASLERSTRQFAERVPEYQRLRKQWLSQRGTRPDELKQNPVTFMEKVVPREFLTNLKPINQEGEEGYQFQLRLESKPVDKILELVSTLEQEPLLTITQFTLIRESLNSSSFNSIMKIRATRQ